MTVSAVRVRAREQLDALTDAREVSVPLNTSVIRGGSAHISLPVSVQDDEHERRVQTAVDIERAKREARRRLDGEERGLVTPPVMETLRDRLARPTCPTASRIAGWQPLGSRVVFSAPFKAGKTTLISNLVRSLADGDAFLGQYAVAPVAGTIALLDFEMGSAQLDAWHRAQRVRNDDRVFVFSMRGQAATFNILDVQVRSAWADLLRQHQVAYLVIDCLRPILDALGLDEHRDAGRFLVALDALLLEAGIGECVVVHHMGHVSERSRGDSRLRDWPDVEWRLVRQNDDPASARYITAFGRDVDVPESQLVYDPVTRALTIANGSRRDAATRGALDAVLAVVDAASEPLSGRAIKKALAESDHRRNAIDNALHLGERTGALAVDDGPRNSKLYHRPASVPVSGSVPAVSLGTESECPAPIREGTLDHSLKGENSPEHSDDPPSERPIRTQSRRGAKAANA